MEEAAGGGSSQPSQPVLAFLRRYRLLPANRLYKLHTFHALLPGWPAGAGAAAGARRRGGGRGRREKEWDSNIFQSGWEGG